MRALLNTIYPGTPLAISAWRASFAGESDFSTALADADAYVIMGRENVYLASRWTAPNPANPNFWALKLYTNYDLSEDHSGLLVAKSGGRVLFLKLGDIDWLEATGNYVTLHAGKESHMLRTAMNALEHRLDPAQFARIHRPSIVNLDRVREMQPLFRGEQVLILKDGTQLSVGRAYRAKLLQQIGNVIS